MRAIGGIALLGLLAACSSSDAANPNNPGSGSPPAASASLKLASSAKFGNYLVDGNGRTLYLFALDLPAGGGNPAVSNCAGSPSDTTSCIYLCRLVRTRAVSAATGTDHARSPTSG